MKWGSIVALQRCGAAFYPAKTELISFNLTSGNRRFRYLFTIESVKLSLKRINSSNPNQFTFVTRAEVVQARVGSLPIVSARKHNLKHAILFWIHLSINLNISNWHSRWPPKQQPAPSSQHPTSQSSAPPQTPRNSDTRVPPFPPQTNKQQLTNPVFTWYTTHSLPATPINPTSASISALSSTYEQTSYPTLASLSLLPHPTETSVSIITPPKVTKKVLEEAKKLGIKGVWLQPGSFDDEILKEALESWKETGVGGEGGRGGEGWCVLVDGERAVKAAGVHKL